MKAKILVITMFFFVGLMGNGLVKAGENEKGKIKTGMKEMQQTQVNMQNAHEIIGMKVTNNQGKKLGWVDDLIFSSDGQLSYLIVSHGGFQSSSTSKGVSGEELTPIPFQAISDGFYVSESWVNIPVTIGQFDTAPSFLKNELDNMRDSNWREEARAYFEDKEKGR